MWQKKTEIHTVGNTIGGEINLFQSDIAAVVPASDVPTSYSFNHILFHLAHYLLVLTSFDERKHTSSHQSYIRIRIGLSYPLVRDAT
jgi:hypothetical protein